MLIISTKLRFRPQIEVIWNVKKKNQIMKYIYDYNSKSRNPTFSFSHIPEASSITQTKATVKLATAAIPTTERIGVYFRDYIVIVKYSTVCPR